MTRRSQFVQTSSQQAALRPPATASALFFCLTLGLVLGMVGCSGGMANSGPPGPSPFTKASTQQWVREFGTGTVSHGDDQGDTLSGAATDAQGNVIAAGYTTGSFPGFTNPDGMSQDFVAKYDPAGTQLWLQQFGTPLGDELAGVAVDPQSNIAVAGVTRGAYPGFANANHYLQAIVKKLDSSGHSLWLQQFSVGTTTTVDGVAVDSQGNVLVCGQVSPSPYPYQTNLMHLGVLLFNSVIPMPPLTLYVAKLNGATGAQEWVQRFGPQSAIDTVSGLAVDAQGDPVIVGTSSGAFPGTSYPAGFNPSLPFVLKLASATGQQVWLQQASTKYLPSGYFYNAVAVDGQGNVVVDGQGNVQGQGPQCLLFKFSGTDGSKMWQQNFGGGQQSLVGGLALDSDGSIMVGGIVGGVLQSSFTPQTDDVFVAKFAASGQPETVQQFGTGKEIAVSDAQISSPISVATDAQNDTFVGGMTVGAFPGFTNANGAQELFLAKFGPQ